VVASFTPLLRATGARYDRPWHAALIAVLLAVLGTAAIAASTLLGKPALAIVVLPAVAAVPLVVTRHRLALGAMACMEAMNLSVILDAYGLPKVHLVLLGLAALGIALRWLVQRVRPKLTIVMWFALAYAAARAASLLAAPNLAAGLADLEDVLKDLLYLAVVITLCVWARGARLVAMCLTGATAALAALGLVQQFVLANSTDFFGLAGLPPATDIGLAVPRHSGPYDDPNFWGRQLVVAAPLALALFADRTHGRRRWWWLAAFAAIAGGVYLTGSRGTQLALGATVVLWCLLSGRRYIRLLFVAPLLVALLLAVPGVGSRLVSLGDTTAEGAQQVDPSLEGRIAAQQMALLMLRDHPAIGVGAANFTTVEPAYQRRYGYNTPVLAPHNLYLEQAAEAGIVGLATWLAFFGAAVFAAVRARLLLRPRHGRAPPAEWYLAGGVVSSLGAWAVASAFLHMATFRVFLLVVAIGVGLDVRARQAAADRLGAPRWQPVMLADAIVPRPRRPPRVRAAYTAAAVALAAVCAGAYTAPGLLFATHWRASAYVEITPRAGSPYSSAYQLDVLSRQALVNTYLALLAAPRFRQEAERAIAMSPGERRNTTVTSSPEAGSAIFAVDVDAPTERGARGVARYARASAGAFVDRAGSLYVFQPREDQDTAVPVRALRTSRAGAAGAFGLLFAAVVYTLVRRWDWFTAPLDRAPARRA
jgi:O-antigen ligase